MGAARGLVTSREFDDCRVAWLATQCSKTAVTELMRIAWRTVGAIITRVWADVEALGDRLDGLRRIGIDEISYRRGQQYLTVVVDHDTRRLLWAAPGRDRATLRTFFELLGPERCALITHVSADQAGWIAEIVAERCPNAVQCADPFHIVKWATEALDEVRRQAWNDACGAAGPNDGRWVRPPRSRPRRPPDQPVPLRALKNPREPHRPPAREGRLDRPHRPAPLSRLPAQRRTALRLLPSRRRWQRSLTALAVLGAALPQLRAFVRLARRVSNILDKIHATLEHNPPTPSSNPSTPRSASSPGSRSDSTHPKPSSHSQCSASPVTDQPSPAETTHRSVN